MTPEAHACSELRDAAQILSAHLDLGTRPSAEELAFALAAMKRGADLLARVDEALRESERVPARFPRTREEAWAWCAAAPTSKERRHREAWTVSLRYGATAVDVESE